MYHEEVNHLVQKYPENVKKFDMSALLGSGYLKHQLQMLRWIGMRFPKLMPAHSNMQNKDPIKRADIPTSKKRLVEAPFYSMRKQLSQLINTTTTSNNSSQ